MKATGIVRRIDDLGRVVVPKEIRRVLRVREGDPLEIYTGSSGEVIQKMRAVTDQIPFLERSMCSISDSFTVETRPAMGRIF